MNPEIKALWIDALRSGKYRQAKHRLHTGGDRFCCLGVLCDVYRQKTGNGQWLVGRDGEYFFGKDCSILPNFVREWAGLDCDNPLIGPEQKDVAANLNDSGTSFPAIADLIERYL